MRLVGIFLIFISFFTHSIAKSYSSDPNQFITELVGDAINKLSDKNLNTEQKKILYLKLLWKTLILAL